MWTLGDGTEISASGEVTGDSELAASMRGRLGAVSLGLPIYVPMGPPPGGEEELDLENPVSIDCWVRESARLAGVEVTDAPEFEADEDGDEDAGEQDEAEALVY